MVSLKQTTATSLEEVLDRTYRPLDVAVETRDTRVKAMGHFFASDFTSTLLVKRKHYTKDVMNTQVKIIHETILPMVLNPISGLLRERSS